MFLVVGSATVDLIITGLDKMPLQRGDEFSLDNLAFCDRPLRLQIGGNGANSAYVLGRLGARCALFSAVGEDELGALMVGWLASAGVDLRYCQRRETAATSTTTAVIDAALNRISFHHAGAYAAITLADLPAAWRSETRGLLITAFPLMTGLRGAGYAALLAEAHTAGILTAVDIGPAIGRPAGMAELIPLLPDVDYLIANRHELSVCWGSDAPEEGARGLLAAGARAVLLKEGAAGAALYAEEGMRRVPGFPVEAASTVGAGDSFNAGLLYGLTEGWPVERAIRFGNAVAALVVSSDRGVLDSPTAAAAEALF